jgi:predicted RNA-binding Zn-ribbon protein involved in translation (DUF1610 family)
MAEEQLSESQIKQMIGMLKAMLPEDEARVEQPATTATQATKAVPIKNAGPDYRNHQHYNKFEDMPERKMYKQDTEIQKKLSQYDPVPRTRQASMVDAKCRMCGKTETVSAQLLHEGAARYKCNDCARGSG